MALMSLTTVLALPAGAIPPPGDPGDPPEPTCIANTRVNSMSVNRRSTLGVNKVQFSWNITKGCSALALSVGGQPVPAVGSIDVSVPTSRRLSVSGQVIGCCSATWHGPFVLAGRFIHYTERANGTLSAGQAQASSGSATTDAAARNVVESMRPGYMDNFTGKRLEIHILPNGHHFRELPPWDNTGSQHDNSAGIGNSSKDAYQDQHGWWGPGPDVHSVGIVEGAGLHTVTHELGHAVLHHAGDDVLREVTRSWAALTLSAVFGVDVEWVGCGRGDDYGATNTQEYWAEGTAALFDIDAACSSTLPPLPDPHQYTQDYLTETDPALDIQLRLVFDV
jgi:hypothetical protein